MLRLVTMGGLRIERDDHASAPHLRRSWLAMLAVIASAGERGIPRERLVAIFWPESSEEHARQSARQALYSVRQELGREVVRTTGASLALEPTAISSDVAEFKAAIEAGDRRRAVALSGTPFLDGFRLPGAPSFERWTEEERSRVDGMRTAALMGLATEATRGHRTDEAVEWWSLLTEADPLSGRYAVGYLKALGARGDRAAALAFARRHEAIIRRELEVEPDPDVRRLEHELRAMPALPPASAPMTTAPLISNDIMPARAGALAARDEATPAPRMRRLARLAVTASVVLAAAIAFRRDWSARADAPPVFAIGAVQDVDTPGETRSGPVFTDMLATNLARIDGLHVVANARLLALLPATTDATDGYADAAKRAGATDLLEGRVAQQGAVLTLELRRVELRTGTVRDAITVTAADRVALVDSATTEMARRFRLSSPNSSVAAATTNSAIAYRFYEEGLRAYQQDDQASARRLMRAALVEDSNFAMAAYYEALLAQSAGDRTPDGRHAALARRTALRLAHRAPDRERLIITANVLGDDMEPGAVAVAESLARRFPEDPASHFALGRALCTVGDWAGSVAALERAITLESQAGIRPGTCRVCEPLNLLTWVYQWYDSLDAATRTAQRQLALRSDAIGPLYTLAAVSARRGDTTAAYGWFRRLLERNLVDRAWKLNLDLLLEQYESFDEALPQLLGSSTSIDGTNARWYQLISWRNQGRYREAELLHRSGRLSTSGRLLEGQPDPFNQALLAMERGDAHIAARIFENVAPPDTTIWSSGHLARHHAWYATLAGMAWAQAGDTARVRVLADSVEVWGRQSLFGRDSRLHHYLRGMLAVAARRDDAAVREFHAAIVSPSLGFTRVNLELGRALLRLDRAAEAIAVLQPALRGELDASNLYVTRTELHELLAQAFDRLGQADSAVGHYGAVVRAWRLADPAFRHRRERAQQRLQALRGRRAGT